MRLPHHAQTTAAGSAGAQNSETNATSGKIQLVGGGPPRVTARRPESRTMREWNVTTLRMRRGPARWAARAQRHTKHTAQPKRALCSAGMLGRATTRCKVQTGDQCKQAQPRRCARCQHGHAAERARGSLGNRRHGSPRCALCRASGHVHIPEHSVVCRVPGRACACTSLKRQHSDCYAASWAP